MQLLQQRRSELLMQFIVITQKCENDYKDKINALLQEKAIKMMKLRHEFFHKLKAMNYDSTNESPLQSQAVPVSILGTNSSNNNTNNNNIPIPSMSTTVSTSLYQI